MGNVRPPSMDVSGTCWDGVVVNKVFAFAVGRQRQGGGCRNWRKQSDSGGYDRLPRCRPSDFAQVNGEKLLISVGFSHRPMPFVSSQR
jgi:hypothetical protein